MMGKKLKIVAGVFLALGVLAAFVTFLRASDIPVLDPKGVIADKERSLMITAGLLSLIVVIPVFALIFWIAWRYREGNPKGKDKYSPDWDGNRVIETIWWVIPLVLILILSAITWRSSHELDPYKKLASSKKPVTIQVIALQWKWLFIYPEQDIASVNFMQIPEDTPINFEITSDAPMNSFWIPRLGGQVYAMSGMTTKLHLEASEIGSYNGSSANISGAGFAGMRFIAKATTHSDFDQWVQSVKESSSRLGMPEYAELAKPSENNPAKFYSSRDKTLYDTVVMKYMSPQTGAHKTATNHMQGYR